MNEFLLHGRHLAGPFLVALDLLGTFVFVAVRGSGVDGAQRIFSALPPQDLKIGPLELTGVPFFSLAGSQKDSIAKGFDGVLTIGLFRRVFIDHTEHFAVLESR